MFPVTSTLLRRLSSIACIKAGRIGTTDIIQTSLTEFNLIKDHRSVIGKVTASDITGKKLQAAVAEEAGIDPA